MREIKFRAWDKINNKMCDYGSDEACTLWEDGCDFMGMSFISCQPNVIWMQYTGLHDKNGKEIYEGDIVKRTCDLIGAEDDGFTGIVKYECAAFLLESFDGKNGRYLWDDVQELEVVGNIYENPELLGGE